MVPGERRIVYRPFSNIAALKRTTIGKVTLEPGSVYLDPLNIANCAQLDDYPVKSRSAPSFRFPPSLMFKARPGIIRLLPVAKKHIAAGQYQSSIFDRGQIHLAANASKGIPVRHDLAVNTQPRHARRPDRS